MAAIWDIIGAMLIGSVLMLVMHRAADNGAREFVNHHADAIVQAELATMTRIIQNDLRKVGYGISESYQASIIQRIDPTHFTYLTKINPATPVADTVEYFITPADQVVIVDASLIFSNIQKVTRIYNETPETTRIGTITNSIVFRYLDQAGRETGIKQSVKMVEVTLSVLNPNIYMDNEALVATTPARRIIEIQKLTRESYWRQTRVVSRNLRR